MNVRRRVLSATFAAIAATFALAAPAGAATLSIEIPNGSEINKPVNITYAGFADAPGTTDITGTGPNMQLRTFYQKDAASCQGTSAAQRTWPNSKFDGDMFVESPAPFSLTSTVVFEQAGNYRFCAYLEVGLTNDTQPPAAFAEAVLRVGAPPIPCTVPKVKGLTLASATKKLKTAGCTLGKVSKPKKVSKKAKLIVRSQSVEPTVVLAPAFKVNLVLKVKPKKKK